MTGDDVEKGLVVGGGFHPAPPPSPCVGEAEGNPPASPEGVAEAVAGDDPIAEPEMAETKDPEIVCPAT